MLIATDARFNYKIVTNYFEPPVVMPNRRSAAFGKFRQSHKYFSLLRSFSLGANCDELKNMKFDL